MHNNTRSKARVRIQNVLIVLLKKKNCRGATGLRLLHLMIYDNMVAVYIL